MSNSPVQLTLEDILSFVNNLRQTLEKLRVESKDANIREYADYLLKDDRHDLKK